MFADVTSANIVGYQEIGVENGYTLTTPTFYAVGGGAVDIQTIIPTGANVPDGSSTDKVRFQFLNEKSEVAGTYYWRDFTKDYKGTLVTFKGWYDKMSASKTDLPATLPIPAGCGLYLNCPVADVTLKIKSPIAQ